MVCPVCARETVTDTGRCSSCGATLLRSDVDVTRLQADAVTALASPAVHEVHEDLTLGGPPLRPAPPARAAGLPEPGEAFGTRYHIIRELGVGGMGAVYQAWDGELGVAVALKLIRPDVDPNVARDMELRFKRELLLARQVTHKNVVRIHDLGELNGIKYITMPYVEGSDLAHTLDAQQKLPVSETVNIAKQVASGLRAAHEVGIVHRDLKPANIMMEGDTALIMDFGIARSVTTPSSGADGVAALAERMPAALRAGTGASAMHSSLTIVGAVVGTIQYMAPEQARGETVDHRADIYAFGLIIYDLLVGRHRHTGYDSAVNELMARTKEAPPAPRTIDPAIPAALDAIVQQCVAVRPEDRYQTTAELAAALDRLDENGNWRPEPKAKRLSLRSAVAIGVVVPLVITGTLWMLSPQPKPAAEPAPVSLLVADFANKTNDPVFSGLVEQALTVGLEGASFVTTYPRRDALRKAHDIAPAGRLDDPTATLVAISEDVSRVVTGSIESTSRGYRLTTNLVDPKADKVLRTWTEQADTREAVLKAVGALAVRVRSELGDTTANTKSGADESFTAASLDAARAYENAQELQWAGKFQEAMAEYRRAIALDPNLGRAYAGLGALAANVGQKQQAEEYYKQALARIDRMTDREKYRTRGGYYLLMRNADKARDEFQALVDKYPADTAGLANLALADFYKRDMAHAVEVGRRAVDIYPRNVVRRNNLALFAMYASDFTSADREAAETLKLNPAREKAFIVQAIAKAALGRPDDARSVYTTLQHVSASGRSMAANGLADLDLYQGRIADAAIVLQAAIKDEQDASRRDRFLVTLAEVRQAQQKPRDAIAVSRQVLKATTDPGTMFLAGRVLASAGDAATAHEVARKLSERLDTDSQVYADLLEGEVALHENEARTAIEKFKSAQQVTDTWLGRFDLGRAYLLGEAYAEANSEFDTCQKRLGEGTAVLLDDVPTLRLTAPLFYYQARALEGLASPGARENYEHFLTIKQGGDEQGVVADARRRLKNR